MQAAPEGPETLRAPPQAARLDYHVIQTRGLAFEVAVHGQGERLALLLHGFPECAHSFRYQVPLLVSLGYRVWAVNMRGYGRSDRPRGRRAYTIDRLEQDVTDLIDASEARSVTLVGHDWGGVVAWSYAMHGARSLDRLVVMNCPHPAAMRRHFNPVQALRSWYIAFFQLPVLPEQMIAANGYRMLEQTIRGSLVHKENVTDDDLAVLRHNAERPGGLTAMLNYYRAMPWSYAELKRRHTRSIDVPTLLLWGERDAALGKELTYDTERYVKDLTLRYLPDASHWVQQDAPVAVNAALASFLR